MSVTLAVTNCHGQGSLFFSGINVCSLITENETLTSSVTTPTPKRNSPDKKRLKRILKTVIIINDC